MDSLNYTNDQLNAKINVHRNQASFYESLRDAVCAAKKEVMFIHLDPYVAIQRDNEGRANYFDAAHEYVRSHAINMRRIISIPNERKLEWTKNLIDKTRQIATLDLSYIKIGNIENSFPKTVISCDIIDNNKLFLLNPILNYIPQGSAFKPIVEIENPAIVNIYKEYFENLWTQLIKENSPYGFYLKKGLDCTYFEKNLSKIKDEIKLNEANMEK